MLFTSQKSLSKFSLSGESMRRGSLWAVFKGKPIDALRGRVWGSWSCIKCEGGGGRPRLGAQVSVSTAACRCLSSEVVWALQPVDGLGSLRLGGGGRGCQERKVGLGPGTEPGLAGIKGGPEGPCGD